MPWTMYSKRPATQRAARALIEDPRQSDLALAELAAVSFTTIASVRAKLELLSVIPRVDPASRIGKGPARASPSATRAAIAQLGPDATPRQVADAAGVSMQAAWKMLARVRPRYADAAAATDQLRCLEDAEDAGRAGRRSRLDQRPGHDHVHPVQPGLSMSPPPTRPGASGGSASDACP